jgi:phage terminase large subunit-like protein
MRAEWAEIDPSERKWYAQVQNDPLPAELGFFAGDPPDFTGFVAPDAHVIFGVDAAFTSSKKSDFFACVGGIAWGNGIGVFGAIRHQRGLAAGLRTLDDLRGRYTNARFVSYVSGAEKGIYDAYFQQGGIPVEQMPARWSKGYRAQKTAVDWRGGLFSVARGRPWTGPFIAEMKAFDGRDDDIDDQVDAAVAMHDALMAHRPAAGFGTTFTFGRAVM